jgi:hypothetical protein
MNKIIILDYSTLEVHVFDIPKGISTQDFIKNHHSEHGRTFDMDSCHCMTLDLSLTEGRLPIYIH